MNFYDKETRDEIPFVPNERYFKKLEKLLVKYHNEETKITVGNRINLSSDGTRLKSLTLGVRGAPGLASKRKDKSLNPNLTKHTQTKVGFKIYKLIYEIVSMTYPAFEFNSIIVNFNSKFLIHKDLKNVNDDSVIFSLGQHTDGGLNIFNDNKELIETKYIWHHPTKFDGKTTYHSTEDFSGDRYCIVAYQTKPKFHLCPYRKLLISI
tara:strand:- start:1507 stop:2130 length:624 start_codon:yes stop_codon:yes gene_type:complete